MQVVLIILSAGLLGLIIYFAVSSKSSRHLKLAAFIALGLIALAVAVAGFFLVSGTGESAYQIPLPAFQEGRQAQDDSNVLEVVIFFLIFVLIMGFIIALTLRKQRKKETGKKPPKSGLGA